MPFAARLLTLTDHPGLDLIIVFNHVGDGADASPSGLLMEIARFHDRAPNAHQRGPADAGSNWGREPLPSIVRSPAGATREETRVAKKRKRKYSRGAGTEVKREMHQRPGQ